MSQIAHIMLKRKLKDKLRFAREYPFFSPVDFYGKDLLELWDLIEKQAETIKGLDQRLAGLMDRLPEDLLKEFTAEVVAEMEGADDEA